nr:PREDICTED: uncharacterized protein LOC109036061 [Bemisia tabaci]
MASDQEISFYRECFKTNSDQRQERTNFDSTKPPLLCGPTLSQISTVCREAEFPPKVPNFNPSIPFFSQDNIACVTSHLQTIRDHLCAFQERQGIPREENNFFGLALIIIQQSGQAMYAVFMLFLALFPVATIFLAILHFIVDRLIDILCTKTPADIYFKLGVLCAQLLLIYLMTQFVVYTIFSPIFTMQLNIISKMIMISRGNLVLK